MAVIRLTNRCDGDSGTQGAVSLVMWYGARSTSNHPALSSVTPCGSHNSAILGLIYRGFRVRTSMVTGEPPLKDIKMANNVACSAFIRSWPVRGDPGGRVCRGCGHPGEAGRRGVLRRDHEGGACTVTSKAQDPRDCTAAATSSALIGSSNAVKRRNGVFASWRVKIVALDR